MLKSRIITTIILPQQAPLKWIKTIGPCVIFNTLQSTCRWLSHDVALSDSLGDSTRATSWKGRCRPQRHNFIMKEKFLHGPRAPYSYAPGQLYKCIMYEYNYVVLLNHVSISLLMLLPLKFMDITWSSTILLFPFFLDFANVFNREIFLSF